MKQSSLDNADTQFKDPTRPFEFAVAGLAAFVCSLVLYLLRDALWGPPEKVALVASATFGAGCLFLLLAGFIAFTNLRLMYRLRPPIPVLLTIIAITVVFIAFTVITIRLSTGTWDMPGFADFYSRWNT